MPFRYSHCECTRVFPIFRSGTRPGKGNSTTDNVDLGRHLVIRIVHCHGPGAFSPDPNSGQ